MNKTGHLLVGFAVGLLFIGATNYFFGWFNYDLKNIVIYLIIIALYCLLPDADMRQSTISFIFVGVSIIGMIFGYNYNDKMILFSAFSLLIITFLAWIIGHRGFVHSIVFAAIVSAPLIYFFSYQVAALAFLCFYSHLAADDCWLKFI
jgi:membrane-bound metal-dependent hydrolase YbcI (DUF457 family)